jgi:hypothetical protein
MTRELPLLIGAVGTVFGFFSLLGVFFVLVLSSRPGEIVGADFPLWVEVSILLWAASPFIALVGSLKVQKRGRLGGVLFVVAGALPLIVSMGAFLLLQLWTPLLILAGILAILDWPGPYVDKEKMDDLAEENSTPL